MNEHRKSLEKGNADADLPEIHRRLRSLWKQNVKGTKWVCRGSGDGMCVKETRRNTGSPSSQVKQLQTGTPRGSGRADMSGGQARSSEEAVNTRRAKGHEFKGNDQRRGKQVIGRGQLTPRRVWELQRSLHAKVGMSPLARKPDAGNLLVRICGERGGNEPLYPEFAACLEFIPINHFHRCICSTFKLHLILYLN